LAIITVTIAPLLFSRIYPRQETRPRSGIIIVGQDQLADYIIERLRRRNESITAICLDQERIRRLQEFGVRVVDGRESYVDALAAAHAAQARVLVDLTSGPEETLEVCQLAKEQFGIPVVISRISDVGLIPHLKRIGVRVVQPELATAMALEGAIRYPTAFDVLAHEAGEIDVAEALVTNPQFSGMPLGEIRLSGEPLILSLQRGNTVMVPHRDTVVHLQDRLGLIGSPAAVEEAVAVLKG
jgi:Trk K+ transport system NAD-binding subunit